MKSYSVNKSHLLPTIFQNLIWGIHKDVVLLQGYAHLPITLFVRLLGFFSFYVFRHLTHGHFLVLFSSLYKHTKSIRHSSLLPILQLSALPEPSHQTLLPLQDPSRDSIHVEVFRGQYTDICSLLQNALKWKGRMVGRVIKQIVKC